MSNKLKGKSKVVPTGLDEVEEKEDTPEVAVDISTSKSKAEEKYEVDPSGASFEHTHTHIYIYIRLFCVNLLYLYWQPVWQHCVVLVSFCLKVLK